MKTYTFIKSICILIVFIGATVLSAMVVILQKGFNIYNITIIFPTATAAAVLLYDVIDNMHKSN